MIQVRVRDKSPKRIIRQLLFERKGERDYDGMYAVIADWSKGRSPEKTFSAYCQYRSWTLAQVLALLEYQCTHIFGAGLDEAEFNDMWPVFRSIIRKQGLLDIAEVRQLLTPESPKASTRFAALEM